MKTIIYLRTSTEDQNPENQLKDCLSINNYGDAGQLIDKQSAWKDNKERKSFDALRKMIFKKRVDHLIVWDLDRIYRNRKKLKEFFELCKISNCKIHSFRQQWLEEMNNIQPPFNEIIHNLMLQIMGWLAEEESTKKSERVKSAIRKKGGVTISYKGNKWGRKALSTQKMNQLRELSTQGKSLREMARELNISKSVVHKYIQVITKEKIEKSRSLSISQLKDDPAEAETK